MHAARKYGAIALMACTAFLSSLTRAPAQEVVATPEVQAGKGLICDTQEQVEQFIALTKTEADLSKAIEAVNTAAGSAEACGLAKIHFVAEEEVRQTGTFKIVRVLVVGLNDGEKWLAIQPPSLQFTIFDPDGQDV